MVIRQEDGISPLQGLSLVRGTPHVLSTLKALAYPQGVEKHSPIIQKPALAFLSGDP